MKVGDYVRTENGLITKIKMFYEQKWGEPKLIYARFLCEDMNIYEYGHPRDTKVSQNIIDLIEVGDYVNGYKVIDIVKGFKVIIDKLELDTTTGLYHNIGITNIKSIVTKEQFKEMEYRIGE